MNLYLCQSLYAIARRAGGTPGEALARIFQLFGA